jgi:Type VI secretion system/phage-baseplate injector OB domain
MSEFFGKYRGKVENNVDPQQMGRLQVSVPAVLASSTENWALPCMPFAGQGVGLFAVPPIGANVWVEFEGGNSDHPIWTGCFWTAKNQVPATPALAEVKVFKTASVEMQFNDLEGVGGFTLTVGKPAVEVPLTLTMNASGIKLSMAAFSIALTSQGVSINDGALEVI